MNIRILALGALVAGVQIANAQIVDFEDLNNNGGSFTHYGDNVNSGGFNFASTTQVGNPNAIASWTAGIGGPYTGSVALFADFIEDALVMTKIGGGLFSVSSIDLADVFRGGTNQVVTVTGTLADNSTVVENVQLTDSTNLLTYNLSLMNNIKSMKLDDGTGSWFQFDNINVVPEPATLIALGAGLAALARRRKA